MEHKEMSIKAAIHYVFKIKLIRTMSKDEIDFIEENKIFESVNPIEAREQAFEYYQNYIDVLLQGVGQQYTSDKDARKYLGKYIETNTTTVKEVDGIKLELDDSWGNGVGIYLVINKPIHADILEDKVGDECLIHGIVKLGYGEQQLMDGLNTEFHYYEHYSYDVKNYKRIVKFYEYDADETSTNQILETPFDWTDYDEPFIEDDEDTDIEESTEYNTLELAKAYEELIEDGENNQVEFKPSMLYYYDKENEKSGYRMFVRHIIASVICSFLNSNGGYLFIGVSDNKKAQGLKDDFSLARPKGKDPKDYFLLEADKIIRDYFKSFASNISGEFIEINGTEIFLFTVFPSINRPVFINDKNGNKEFYVRLMGSCEPYKDIENIATYCIDRWGKKPPE